MQKKWVLVTNNPSHYRQEIYKKLSERGVDFNFATGDFSIAKLDVSIIATKVFESKCYRLGPFYFVPSSVLRALSYDNIIITGNFFYIHTWLILIIAKLLGKKTYAWGHSWYGREGFLKSYLKKFYFSFAHKILTYGEYAKGLMVANGFDEKKIVPIYNSLSYEKHLKLRKEILYLDELAQTKDPYLVFIGRLTHVKRLDLLVNALSRLNPRFPNLRLKFIGQEHDGGALKRLVNELKVDHLVDFLGPSYDERYISTILSGAKVCVSPGNVGLTAIHSLTFGTPVISHDDFPKQMPEFESIVPGLTGYFFKAKDLDSLCEKIELVMLLKDEEYALMRRNCMDEVDHKWNTRKQMQIFTALGLKVTD